MLHVHMTWKLQPVGIRIKFISGKVWLQQYRKITYILKIFIGIGR